MESLRAAFEAVFPPPYLIKEHGFNSGWNPKCVPPPSADVWVSLFLLRIGSHYSFESALIIPPSNQLAPKADAPLPPFFNQASNLKK
ncbi:hypothetical protein CJP46_19455 [Paenibacillus sp. XY044]|nr:hypothetical protein CJP46_19455 [Paenibacillus sp. XY044]